VPALIGAFAAAPVLARELESGTFRYAWTQGFGRWRWALAKLAPLAVVVALAAGALSLLISWYYQPYFGARNSALFIPTMSPMSSGVFDLRGVTFGAWTLAAFAIGGLAGMLIRRVVPAIVATLAVYAGIAFATALYLRDHYLAPLVVRNFFNPPASVLLVRQWWTKGGAPVSQARIYQVFNSLFFQLMPTGKGGDVKAEKLATYVGVERHLSRQGYTLWTSYQPAGRFWPFQWIEAGWLLGLSALLIAATVWLVRRRAT
jgi:ABC-type transport system involved in multi-copper enzyme maturation permease subunit